MLEYIKHSNKYKKAIWVYLILLIFEGALRKWVLPSLSTPLLVVRDPIVVYLVCVGLFKGWLKNGYCISIMLISTISLLISLLFKHGDLFVGLYGWRIYFFYCPFIYVIKKVFNRNDVLAIGKFIIYISLPMTALLFLQFYSPQSAWVNIGVAGEGSSGFQGGGGYFRSSVTFSFVAGYVIFQSIVGCFICFYLYMNNTLKKPFKIPQHILYSALVAYIISVPMSVSRTHFFQTLVILMFFFLVALFKHRHRANLIKITLISIFLVIIAMSLNLFGDSIMAFTYRFVAASETEGGLSGTIGRRYLGAFLRGLFNFDIPFFGYGIGIATNAGSTLMNATMFTFFNGEEEWSRIVGECGILVGWIIIYIRVALSLKILKRSVFRMMKKTNYDLLPWFLSAAMLLILPQGQMGVAPNLGLCVFIAGLAFAALKSPSTR